MADTSERIILPPGWHIQLRGAAKDIEAWSSYFKPPFDPVVIKDGDEGFLFSSDLQAAANAEEVQEKASGLVARLRGAIALSRQVGQISAGPVVKADEEGGRHVFVTAHCAVSFSGFIVAMRGEAFDRNGNPIEQEPQPSEPQRLNQLAAANDGFADLLEQLARADNWYDLYKSCELTEHLVGGVHDLVKMLGDDGERYRSMRQTANFYRHARPRRPDYLFTLSEAQSLLKIVVRQTIARLMPVSS